MRRAAIIVMMSGTAVGLAALALLLGGVWDMATYALIASGGLTIVGSFMGMVAAKRHRHPAT